MAGEYLLANGLETDWKIHDSTWKKGVDRNWKFIDWSLYKNITEVVNTSGDLPPAPANGDAFIVQTENQTWVWNSITTQFDKFDLINPFIFYDLDLGGWYQWVAGVIGVFSGGGGTGDVLGPASSVDERIAVFDGITGKEIKDGGYTIADIIALAGTGTVTSVNVTTANGVSATGGPITTSGSFTFSLGNITPTSVAASGTVTGSNLSGTNTGDQTITLTGDVTGSGTGSFAATIANDAVTFAKFQNIITNKLLGRATGGSGDMEEITLGTGLSYTGTTLNVSGFSSSTLTQNHIFVGNASNVATDVAMSGDATIVSSGALTIAANAVTYAKMQAASGFSKLIGSPSASTTLQEITLGTGLSMTLGTLAVTITQYTDEMAQDAVGAMIDATLEYNDATPLFRRAALTGDITASAGSNATTLASVIVAGGPTGSATVAPIITWDAKGRLTAVSSATITPAASSITGGAALTKTDDTNVTLTLGGSPTTALLAATSLTLGWTGQLSGARGGTGVNNSGKTITLGGSLTLSGAFDLTLTQTGTTNVTLPTTGTLATLAGTETFTNKTLTSAKITTGLEPTTNDGAALGTTSKQFSDLFLAEGGVINWDNGDATMTQTGDDITFAGITSFGLGTSTAVTLGTIELGAASDTTLARVSAGVMSVEGVTVATSSNTLTLTNKTIGVTQLNGSSYTMAVNNTNATANYTETTARFDSIQTYSGTITWSGTTAPSGATNHTYNWTRFGNMVMMNISLVYATAGTALTQALMTLPSGAPNPVEPTGLGATTEKLYSATGYVDSAKTGAPPACRSWMRVNSGDTGYELVIVVASNNATVANITVMYPTS